MYSPNPFRIEDILILKKFIKSNGFATLVSTHNTNPLATHIPLYIEERGTKHILVGHMSRANEQAKALENESNVLAIFYGAQGYVSAYAKDPKELKITPTYDYQIVHAKGKLQFVSRDKLEKSLYKLMGIYEKGQPKEMDLSKYPKASLERSLNAIIGFEIEVEEWLGCFRLNQNRTKEEREHIKQCVKENTALVKAIDNFNS